jgi:cytochrome P450
MTASTTNPQPPAVDGLPLIGSSLNLLYDPLSYLVEKYHELGPVFRMQMGFTHYTVMAGIDANRFLATEGERVFSSESLFGGLAKEMKTDTMLVALDGPPHRHMRRLLRPGFARSAAHPHLAAMLDVVAEYAATWQAGGMIPVMETMRRIVVDQIGLITTGFRTGEYFEDILTLINTQLNVEALKIWPRIMMKRPTYQRAKKRVQVFGQQILQAHQNGDQQNMVGHVLASQRPDGDDFTENDLISIIVGAFFAGMDTVASTMAFFMYALHKHPDALAEARREVDALFASGTPAVEDFHQLPTLEAIMLETLRLYPATPFTPRIVAQPFTFAGYDFQPGQEVMIAQTVTHMLPEYYPDPTRFDIQHHLSGENSRIPHVFTPYSLGNHTCLGAGLAERQMLITAAALLHHAEFALEHPDYTVRIHTMPLPNPGKRFKLRVESIRDA